MYTVIDLGVLPGDLFSKARRVNNASHVVGYSTPNALTSPRHAFIWRGGAMASVHAMIAGAASSDAYDLNNSKEIVGTWNRSAVPSNQLPPQAFHWKQGAMTYPAGLPGSAWAQATAINDVGVVAGSSGVGLIDHPIAVLWEPGQPTRSLESLPLDEHPIAELSNDINELNEVVGNPLHPEIERAWHWQGGKTTQLRHLGERAYARAINNKGAIAGAASASASSWPQHPVVWPKAGQKPKDLLSPGFSFGFAQGINDAGQIVGYQGNIAGVFQAFLWENGVGKRLNDLVDAPLGWNLKEAQGINDKGEIVGVGSFQDANDPAKSFEDHAFLARPVPPEWRSLEIERLLPWLIFGGIRLGGKGVVVGPRGPEPIPPGWLSSSPPAHVNLLVGQAILRASSLLKDVKAREAIRAAAADAIRRAARELLDLLTKE